MTSEYGRKTGNVAKRVVPGSQHPEFMRVKQARTKSLAKHLKKPNFKIQKTNPIWDFLKNAGPGNKIANFKITTKKFHKFHEGSINEIPTTKFHRIIFRITENENVANLIKARKIDSSKMKAILAVDPEIFSLIFASKSMTESDILDAREKIATYKWLKTEFRYNSAVPSFHLFSLTFSFTDEQNS